MQISTGTAEDHPTLLTSTSPAVAPVTQTAGSGTEQGGVMRPDMFGEQQRQGEAEVAAAQASG